MRPSRLAVVSIVALLVAACSTSARSTPSFTAAVPASQPGASATLQIINVKLSDTLRMEPATMTVRAGEPISFVVTNTGLLNHEFYLGDHAAQLAHEKEMSGMSGMTHDEPQGIGLMPGQTKTLEYTFAAPGTYEAGCHVTGHYAGGMKATITVSS